MVNYAPGFGGILRVYRKIVIMERLFKNGIVTTIIGILILAGGTYMYLSKSFTAMEAAELSAIGLIFLRSKDSLIGINGTKKGSGGSSS